MNRTRAWKPRVASGLIGCVVMGMAWLLAPTDLMGQRQTLLRGMVGRYDYGGSGHYELTYVSSSGSVTIDDSSGSRSVSLTQSDWVTLENQGPASVDYGCTDTWTYQWVPGAGLTVDEDPPKPTVMILDGSQAQLVFYPTNLAPGATAVGDADAECTCATYSQKYTEHCEVTGADTPGDPSTVVYTGTGGGPFTMETPVMLDVAGSFEVNMKGKMRLSGIMGAYYATGLPKFGHRVDKPVTIETPQQFGYQPLNHDFTIGGQWYAIGWRNPKLKIPIEVSHEGPELYIYKGTEGPSLHEVAGPYYGGDWNHAIQITEAGECLVRATMLYEHSTKGWIPADWTPFMCPHDYLDVTGR